MKPEPMLVMTAYDAVDDEDCGCETCTTSWGTEPLPVTVLEAPAAQQAVRLRDLSDWDDEDRVRCEPTGSSQI